MLGFLVKCFTYGKISMREMGKFFYAVQKGRKPGVYSTWNECKSQVDGFPFPKYRKFFTEEEALNFVKGIATLPESKNSEAGSSSGSGTEKLRKHQADTQGAESNNTEPPSKKSKTINYERYKEGIEVVGNKKIAHIYTDGACSSNGRSGACAGIGVYWGPNHELNVSERLGGRQTNNRAEILAAARALRQAKALDIKDVVLYTDSNFVINSVTKWMHGWKKNGWKVSNGGPVKNREELEVLDKATKGLNIEWIHVRGHRGVVGNVEADRLAVQALDHPNPDGNA